MFCVSIEHGEPADSGKRIDKVRDTCVPKQKLSNVLVLGVDVVSGQAIETAVEYMRTREVRSMKTACLFKNKVSAFKPDYWATETVGRLRFPWQVRSFEETYLNAER